MKAIIDDPEANGYGSISIKLCAELGYSPGWVHGQHCTVLTPDLAGSLDDEVPFNLTRNLCKNRNKGTP